MTNQNANFKTEKELQDAILKEKAKGTPDLEIGQKYGVTFRYIERLITKTQGLNISSLNVPKKIRRLYPKDFRDEQTTVWSFKQRGNWATHSGEYRGNWTPYIPRNVILKYSKPGDLVLDYFCGAGTTAVECKLLGRRCIALDINDKAIELSKKNVDFSKQSKQLSFFDEKINLKIYEPELLVGDARDLSFLKDNSVDLICSHPPYANIIHYTDAKEGDLSFLNVDDFLKEMSKVARESFRVLKPGRQCAILIGDIRRKKHVIPLGFKLINVYLDVGFKLRELVIKRQHNCKTTGIWYKNSRKYNFLLLAHEYLPIFEKPKVPTSTNVREKEIDYGLFSFLVERPSLKGRLERFETTTVWNFPEKNFEEYLNKNVIDRYSGGKNYLIVTLVSDSKLDENSLQRNTQKDNQLLFVKFIPLDNEVSFSNIEYYLKGIKAFVNQQLPTLNKGGFVVIQTQDIRIDGYIEPLGKRIVDILTFNNLWLKEIIIATTEDSNLSQHDSRGYLRIVHQYLLVYEVK